MTKAEMETLEAFIDGYGLAGVLDTIGEICGLKSVHIAENWQDTSLAKIWAEAADRMSILAVAMSHEPSLIVRRPYLNEGRE